MLAVYAKERQPAPTLTTKPLPQSIARELGALQEDITRLRNRLEAAEQGLTQPQVLTSLRRRIEALEAEKRVLEEALEQLMENRTTFIVAHRLSTIQHADMILVMKEGCIVDAGTHPQLLGKEGLYQELYKGMA